LANAGTRALRYELNGAASNYPEFDGRTLSNVRLAAGNVAIFRIDP